MFAQVIILKLVKNKPQLQKNILKINGFNVVFVSKIGQFIPLR